MTTCRHCGQAFAQLDRHEAVCPHNPLVAAPLRAFMHEWSENGEALSSVLYAEMRGMADVPLPWPRTLMRVFGSWREFVLWCGLRPRLTRKAQAAYTSDPCDMPGSCLADDTPWHDPSCLRREPVVRPVLRWQPQAHAWAVVGEQLVWQVR